MASGAEPIPSRVSTACARCRKQKLKCDTTKPCTLCVRAGTTCQPRTILEPKTRSRRLRPTDSISPKSRPIRRSQSRTASTSSAATHPSPSHVSPLGRPVAPDPAESLQFGANRSAISLAMNMYQTLGTQAPTRGATNLGAVTPHSPTWKLRCLQMPPQSAMETLLAVYFDKVHWFIWILHEPTFMAQAKELLSAPSWTRQDMKIVLVIITVAALGLKCALQNTSAEGRRRLESISSDPRNLVEEMIGEVKLHLLDLLDDACIETVQVTVLLGGFYIFHGSPGLAWSMIGMAVRASYGLALHCASDDEAEISTATQVRRRCWNHIIVADTFASQIYGRPASLDPAFSELLPMAQMDDTAIYGLPSTPESQVYNGSDADDGPVNALTFHWLKYKLYLIIKETQATFRLLRPRSPMTLEDLHALLEAVQRIDQRLAEWTRSLPSPFDKSNGIFSGNDDEDVQDVPSPFPRLFDPGAGERTGEDPTLRRLRFQAWLLQDTYNAAVMLAHRPLLEYRLSADYRRSPLPKHISSLVSASFNTAVKAALRISKTPVMQFEHEYCLAFIFIHLFTAGVILCIPPTSHPHSEMAQEAKAGVFRIISAAKALRSHSQIARHAEQSLSDLLKLSLYREVDLAFKEDRALEAAPVQAAFREAAPMPDGPEPTLGQTSDQGYHTAPDDVVQQQLPNDGVDRFPDQWTEESYLVDPNVSYLQGLDLPLDEAFGAFGQAMFNLTPDDPLNNWGWGKGFM